MNDFAPENYHIGVIGLGYVGMPLALKLAQHFKTIGFDTEQKRIEDLRGGWDSNREVKQAALRATTCRMTCDPDELAACNIFIVTVPTPVDTENRPDLSALQSATRTVAQHLKQNDVVVYESTVYPGVTEKYCGPLLEELSGLKSGKEFFLGYSPERINPGDKTNTVENITKVVAGQNEYVTSLLSRIYACVTNGNVFEAKDIMTAEASKVIENAQRDINVAFVNEVTMILNKMGLSAYDVLETAGTKWNFLPFKPGLVGGHCISVDPYYLAHCARDLGHEPEVILSGRKINDNMGAYVGGLMDRLLPGPSKILVLGFTFKENINDIRNSKAIDVISALQEMGHQVDVHDPHAISEEVSDTFGVELLPSLNHHHNTPGYDAIILLVAHDIYKAMSAAMLESLLSENGMIFDMKAIWADKVFDGNIGYRTL